MGRFGSCWTCGGPHFAEQCPKGAGKSGGKGFNMIGTHWPTPGEAQAQPQPRILGAFRTVTTSNRFAALISDDDERNGDMGANEDCSQQQQQQKKQQHVAAATAQ